MTASPTSQGPELLPCPFCGGEAKRVTLGKNDGPENEGGDVINCTRCWASSHIEFGRKENLVDCWNIRTTDPSKAALLEALVEAKREMWSIARHQWTMADFKNWAVIQQIDAALALAKSETALTKGEGE